MNSYAYDLITDRIVTLLTQATVPWHKPWKTRTGWPRNFVTNSSYRGINVFLLLSMGYESPYWLTYPQATIRGGTVRKGEKSCPVVFWKRVAIDDPGSDEDRQIPVLRLYHVFNTMQCDGIGEAPAAGPSSEPLGGRPAEIVENMPQRPLIKHGMTQAFYSPAEDLVGLPLRERFDKEEEYYSTIFHELVHSTGHRSRLHRLALSEKAGFGSDPYCKEELIAEMGAAFLCGHAEISERTVDNSVAYLNGWLGKLKRDKTLLVHAAAQAQKAVDFILAASPASLATSEPQEIEIPVSAEVAL